MSASSADRSATVRGTVLVVDDEEPNRDLLHDLLGTQGYQAIEAADGEQALQLAEEKNPDAILLDMILPGEEHLVLLTSLKCEPELRDIPIVAMTGGEIGRAEREILESFAIPVVQKPWTLGEIEILIYHAILGKHYASASRRARPV